MDTNERFNEELAQFFAGELPAHHIFKLGLPGEILRNTGFPPNDEIELPAARLREKMSVERHPFDPNEVKNLVSALAEPVAVFGYGDESKAQNVIVDLQKDGKNFLAGIHFNQERDGMVVSSVRTLFNKDVHKWLNWIGGKRNELLYADIKKLQGLVAQQQTNTADVDYLDLKVIENLIERHRAVKDYYSPSALKPTTQNKGEKMADSIFSSITDKLKSVLGIPASDAADEQFLDADDASQVNRDSEDFERMKSVGLLTPARAAEPIVPIADFDEKITRLEARVNKVSIPLAANGEPPLAVIAALRGEKMAVSNKEFFEVVRSGSLADVQAAIVAGADVNAKFDTYDDTPLHSAAGKNPNPEIITALIKAGADVNAKDVQDGTPLHDAVLRNPAVIAALISAGANVNDKTFEDKTPLDYAVEKGNKEVVDLLRAAGAKTGKELFDEWTVTKYISGEVENQDPNVKAFDERAKETINAALAATAKKMGISYRDKAVENEKPQTVEKEVAPVGRSAGMGR
ncbi:MAG: ankyrin repeat domain-containing protein [Planctomycetota bacterium]|nr:ankyrin repeat domain-containing protein [Planctomycetota bacterium]